MDLNKKQPWNHTKQCDYCAEHTELVDVVYTNGQSGCRHFRGGKSAADRGQSWPALERGKVI